MSAPAALAAGVLYLPKVFTGGNLVWYSNACYYIYMMQEWQQFISRPISWISLSLAALINLAIWGILLINITPTSDLIVLHYTLYFGVDMVGKWSESLAIPGFGLCLIVMNTIFAHYFFRKNHIVSYFFLIVNPIFQLFLFFAAIFLVIANLPAQV